MPQGFPASSEPPVVEQLAIDCRLLQLLLQLFLFNLQKREDMRCGVSDPLWSVEGRGKMKPHRSQLGEDAEGQWNHHSEDHCSAHMAKRCS